MITELLAFITMGPFEWIIVLITCGVPILAVVLIVRYLTRNKRENQRLRMEVGKLADELEKTRKQNEDS